MMGDKVRRIQLAQVFSHSRDRFEFSLSRDDTSREVEYFLDGGQIFTRTVEVDR